MNLILFEREEIARPLLRTDRRAIHVIEVLRRGVGDTFDVGIIDGPRGKATLQRTAGDELALTYAWGDTPPPLDPITIIVGLPRPQTARDLLRELAALGVRKLHFVATEKSEPSYASATLWTTNEWRRQLIAGAEQAFDTRLPEVTYGQTLHHVLKDLSSDGARLALDNYEAPTSLTNSLVPANSSVVLALGAERGWSDRDRQALREHHFTLVNLGPRVLRVETAAIAAVSILKAKRGLI